MKLILVPGYREIFESDPPEYTELVKEIPSEAVISILITLNNELNAPLKNSENQQRLRTIFSERFSARNLQRLNSAYNRFLNRTQGKYKQDVFGRRYLLEMILKETNNFRSFEKADTIGDDEFNILLAYLITIDEVNAKDQILLQEALKFKGDPLYDYRILWTPNISQIEFSEYANPVYGFFRLLALLRFSLDNFKEYLIEYIHSFGFINLSQFMASINQVVMSTFQYNKDAKFKKLSFIVPSENVDTSHLRHQSINGIIGEKEPIGLSDLRKYPLFDNNRNGYIVIDEDIYKKKTYKGPFFDLYRNTSLHTKKSFNAYSSDISLGVLEQLCFQKILYSLPKIKYDILHFDDGSDSVPDCYYRHNKSIALFEFKGYIFPDDLSANPNFDNIKKYIDLRFVANEKDKPKGVGQIINQIKLLRENEYNFDIELNRKLKNKKIKIYPIIVHTEFHFSMPGISNYLNEILQSNLDTESLNRFDVGPLIMINLEVLFHFALHQGSFKLFLQLVDRYHKIIQNRIHNHTKLQTVDSFLRSKASFDEIYNTIFISEVEKVYRTINSQLKLIELVGISQEELDEIL